MARLLIRDVPYRSLITVIKLVVKGSVCGNDTVIHLTVDSLPFGGVGASGMGRYHGKFSFQTFSNAKAVLIRDFNPALEAIGGRRYPPYTLSKVKFMNTLLQKRTDYTPKYWSQYLMFALGIISVLSIQAWIN